MPSLSEYIGPQPTANQFSTPLHDALAEGTATLCAWKGFWVFEDNVPEQRPGIYVFWNIVNGKPYVGVSEKLRSRCVGHARCQSDAKFGRALRKYGKDKFILTPIFYETQHNREWLLQQETTLIVALDSVDNGYNIQRASESVGPYGDTFAAIAREVASRPDVKLKRSLAQKALNRGPEQWQWASEAKQRLYEDALARGEKFRWFHTLDDQEYQDVEKRDEADIEGRSDKSRAANSVGHKGIVVSDDTRALLSSQRRGVPKTQAHAEAIGCAVRRAHAKGLLTGLQDFVGTRWWRSQDGSVRYRAVESRSPDHIAGQGPRSRAITL